MTQPTRTKAHRPQRPRQNTAHRPRVNKPVTPDLSQLPPLPHGWKYDPTGRPVPDPHARPQRQRQKPPEPKPKANAPKKRRLTPEEIEELKEKRRLIAEAKALLDAGELDIESHVDDEQPPSLPKPRQQKTARKSSVVYEDIPRRRRIDKPLPEPEFFDDDIDDDDDDEFEPIAPVKKKTPRKKTRRAAKTAAAAGGVSIMTICMVATLGVAATGGIAYGIYNFTDGIREEVRQVDVPLPPQQLSEAKDASKLAPRLNGDETITNTGQIISPWDKMYPVHDADQGGGEQGWSDWEGKTTTPIRQMSINAMAPMSVFIPETGIYFQMRSSDKFTGSNYQNFDTLSIPDNPHRGVWYKDGAPVTGGKKGTTLIGSHVSHGTSVRGALYDLHQMKLGEVIWTKGEDGSVTSWKLVKLWYLPHRQFPQSYFSAEGVRQLVLTTCGGHLNPEGYFDQNVFAVAVPTAIDMDDPQGAFSDNTSTQPSSQETSPTPSAEDEQKADHSGQPGDGDEQKDTQTPSDAPQDQKIESVPLPKNLGDHPGGIQPL